MRPVGLLWLVRLLAGGLVVRIMLGRSQRPSESSQPIRDGSEVQSGNTSGVSGS